ncbi:erythromycin esterase family protein [Hymenobacter sp. BRD128]|uniref:erythromycin esterase family protein n=1 Tax=Hymenobacter sp. BRD128 TaxID=2675878 RepID=UPI001565760D|nr:erythromycin esterase family protein [Hymenobacter sp. BRD128]QKG56456.1 erythromycin esterase family protein [Hymenobacter sp. BRD128]
MSSPFPNGRPTTPANWPARSWLGLLLLLAFSQLQAQAPADIARLNQQVAPITAVRAGSGFADLAPLAPVVAPARVVGLGECTHGSHEVFQLKHRLLEYLVTQQGFTTLALEVDYGYAEILNEYIQTGAGDSLTVHQAVGFHIWDTTEFWDMVEWLRAYNQQHAAKIRYVGIDMQNPEPNLLRLAHFATQRADTVLQRQVRSLRTAYTAPNQASAAAKQRLVRLSDELVQHLQAVVAPAAMQQHGQVLRQRAELLGQNFAKYNTVRDQAMATNVAWLLQQEPTAKVVVWAHNQHIRRDDDQPRLGQLLAKQLGPAYVAVGFATGHGTASVFDPDGSFRALGLAPPVPNSFETWLDQATPPTYFLQLRSAAVADKWLTTRRKFRQIGETAPNGLNGQFMWYAPLSKAFDALVYLHETSASQPYPAAHPAR